MGVPCNLEPARNQPTSGDCFCVCGDNLVYIQPKPPESKKPKEVSYLRPDCNGGTCYPPPSCKPYPISKLQLQGKMDGITTHKKEYVALPYSKRDISEHGSSLKKTGMPMDCVTTFRISYLDPTGYETPSKLAKPEKNLARSEAKLDTATTYKLSYIPHKVAGVEEAPWAKNQALKTGTGEMEKLTTYYARLCNPWVSRYFPDGRESCETPTKKKDLL